MSTADLPGTKPAHSDTSELTALVEGRDWSQTPLGPAYTWPQSLRSVVNIVLTSRYAMWMGWGRELTFLYNDAYRPTLGIKHPWALGSPAEKVWAEIWGEIGPRIQSVLATGKATYDEALLLFLERSGFREETYHTFSYSPLFDDLGSVNGMLCVVTEDTERVLSGRRLATLSSGGASLAAAHTEAETIAAIEQQLGSNSRDLPFTLTYLFDAQGDARLVSSTGFESEHPLAPKLIAKDANHPWPANDVFQHTGPPLMHLAMWNDSASLPVGAWDKPPTDAAIVPIQQQASSRPAGFLVVGLNPYRMYDQHYRDFVDLVGGQIGSAIASARAYEEERRRAEALAEIDRAKTTFFSNVSHEFRTPLTLILGPVDDLLANPTGDLAGDARSLLETAQRSGRRLQRLVNTLLDFSRIEAGRAQAGYEPVDLAAVTADLASSFRSVMERAGLNFVVDIRPLSRPVYIDCEMWEKIVLNLLSNAFKYTLEGTVTVTLAERGDRVELAVSDTGGGIPEEELPRLFERFHRVEGARGRTHEGTGIGLALAQELVKLHGGTIGVESRYARGSTFTVSLPFGSDHLPQDRVGVDRGSSGTALHTDAYVDEALHWLPELEDGISVGSAADLGAAWQPGSAARSVVLLADDNADMRDYVRRLLSARYEVLAVSNGEEAYQAALDRKPDLVLTDVMMPVMDGFALLRALRDNQATKTLPILMLSARAGEESRVEGLHAGADDYLVKPFTARELLARVDAHLSLARMRRQADEARRLSEARLGLALEAANMVAWEWDLATDALAFNGDLKSVFGVELRNSREGFALVHPDDEPLHRAQVNRVIQHGGSYLSEFRICRAGSGEIVWAEDRGTAIAGETGEVTRLVGVLMDVTARKLAEEEIRHRNAELQKANSELEEFAYVASHDLQEPLRTVNIYTQLLLRYIGRQNDPAAAQYAGFIDRSVVQMESLIKDLLFYSRVVHPEQEPPHAADLNRSLEYALSILEITIQETAATIVHDSLPVVWGDERQLALVFQNLLSNAMRYRRTDVAPRVEIVSEQRDGEWVVSVRDNGIGFHPQYAVRIFGLFKRLHKEAYPGTGLGLAIAKRIVERYGGRIWAESAGEGCGAVFSFSLARPR
jgi:PAS domain S-box-containing protein